MRSSTSVFKRFFNNLEWIIALKTALSATISYLISVGISNLLDRPDTLVSGLWSVMTAIVLSQGNIGVTYKAAWIRFLGVIVGSILGGVFTTYIGSGPLNLGLAIFATVIICSLFHIKDSFRIACMTVAIVMLLWGFKQSVSPWTFSFFRFIDSCIGILTTLLIAHFVLPEKALVNLENNIAKILTNLGKFYRLSLTTETDLKESDQTSRELFFEIDELLRENRDLLEDSRVESFARSSFLDEWTLISYQMISLFETIDSIRLSEKAPLYKIFDDALEGRVQKVIDQTDLTFEELARMISNKQDAAHIQELDKSLKELNEEQIRFRSTRTTRKFSLMDVESFFVFFYSLKVVGDELIKMEKILKTIKQTR